MIELTLRQKQRLKIRSLYLFYEIVTKCSFYFIAGLVLGVMLVINTVSDALNDSSLNDLINSCNVLISKK